MISRCSADPFYQANSKSSLYDQPTDRRTDILPRRRTAGPSALQNASAFFTASAAVSEKCLPSRRLQYPTTDVLSSRPICLLSSLGISLPPRVSTRKLRYRKRDRAMRFCCAILMQYRYDPAMKVRSSDINKGARQMLCRNYGLRPGTHLVSPEFLHVPLGIGG